MTTGGDLKKRKLWEIGVSDHSSTPTYLEALAVAMLSSQAMSRIPLGGFQPRQMGRSSQSLPWTLTKHFLESEKVWGSCLTYEVLLPK